MEYDMRVSTSYNPKYYNQNSDSSEIMEDAKNAEYSSPEKNDPNDIFTEQELLCIASLRAGVKSFVEETGVVATRLTSDATLWRFLVARDWDEEEAAEMFQSSVAFHVKFDYPARLSEYQAQQKWWTKVGKRCFYAMLLPGVRNRFGGGVAVEQLGKLDLDGMYRNPEAFEACICAYKCYLESCWESVVALKGKQQILVICDLSGLSLSFLWYIQTYMRIGDIGPAYFPEVCYKVIACNAPSAVTAVWAAVREFLPERTRNKVEIYGSDFMDAVLPELNGDITCLLRFLGGETEFPDMPKAQPIDFAIFELEAEGYTLEEDE